MHLDCAQAALRLCPYIQRGSMKRRANTAGSVTPPRLDESRSTHWVLCTTRNYRIKLEPAAGGAIAMFIAAPAKRLDYYSYDDTGQLVAGPGS